MTNKHPPMSLSHDEEMFLRHWIYDEAHYMEGVGPAKRLQVEQCERDIEVTVGASDLFTTNSSCINGVPRDIKSGRDESLLFVSAQPNVTD